MPKLKYQRPWPPLSNLPLDRFVVGCDFQTPKLQLMTLILLVHVVSFPGASSLLLPARLLVLPDHVPPRAVDLGLLGPRGDHALILRIGQFCFPICMLYVKVGGRCTVDLNVFRI